MLGSLGAPIDVSNFFFQGPPGPPGRLVGVELGLVLCLPLPQPVVSCIFPLNPLPSQTHDTSIDLRHLLLSPFPLSSLRFPPEVFILIISLQVDAGIEPRDKVQGSVGRLKPQVWEVSSGPCDKIRLKCP